MTRDDIIRMAREVSTKERLPWNGEWVFRSRKELEHFAALVAAAEREACAKVCDKPGWNTSNWCAKAIRERGQA